jgi:hypothetical protein
LARQELPLSVFEVQASRQTPAESFELLKMMQKKSMKLVMIIVTTMILARVRMLSVLAMEPPL